MSIALRVDGCGMVIPVGRLSGRRAERNHLADPSYDLYTGNDYGASGERRTKGFVGGGMGIGASDMEWADPEPTTSLCLFFDVIVFRAVPLGGYPDISGHDKSGW